MPISVTCDSCGHTGRVGDAVAGKTLKCPRCGNKFRAGGAAATPPPSAAPRTRASDVPLARVLEDDEAATPYRVASACPDCGADMAANAVICTSCGLDIRTGQKHRRADTVPPAAPVPTYTSSVSDTPSRSTSGDSGLSSIVWFVMIFGVGNAILYYFTGFVIIPIRR